MRKLLQMKLETGLEAFYAIWPRKGLDLYYSSRTGYYLHGETTSVSSKTFTHISWASITNHLSRIIFRKQLENSQ